MMKTCKITAVERCLNLYRTPHSHVRRIPKVYCTSTYRPPRCTGVDIVGGMSGIGDVVAGVRRPHVLIHAVLHTDNRILYAEPPRCPACRLPNLLPAQQVYRCVLLAMFYFDTLWCESIRRVSTVQSVVNLALAATAVTAAAAVVVGLALVVVRAQSSHISNYYYYYYYFKGLPGKQPSEHRHYTREHTGLQLLLL